ncbi:MAG TPA: GAF domain-containing protein, partial [Spirochaetes bacterium]|nr:GAF domain-containing protein [Spirochaetota bacterium]
MGLLEKALEFKKEVNSKGRETLIDRIQGPAETGFAGEDTPASRPADDGPLAERGNTVDDDLFQLPPDDGTPPGQYESPEQDGISPDDTGPAALENRARESRALDHSVATPIEGPLGPEDAPDLSVVKKRIKSIEQEEIIDTELEITIFDDDGDRESERAAAQIDAYGINEEDDTPRGPDDDEDIWTLEGEEEKDAGVPKPVKRDEGAEESTTKDEENFKERISSRLEKSVSHNKKFHDFMVLYEIGKEIVRADNLRDLYDIIMFSIMGQIGVSSTTILVPSKDDENSWVVAESRGIQLRDSAVLYSAESGILGSLVKKRSVVDLNEYRDRPDHQEEYFKLISIDARLLCPLSSNGAIFGAIVLGEKISIGDYTDEEKDFLLSVAEIAAMALEKMRTINDLGKTLNVRERESQIGRALDQVIEKTGGPVDTDGLTEIVTDLCEQAGLWSYGLFLLDSQTGEYVPEIVDARDSLTIREDGLKIEKSSSLIELARNSPGEIAIDDFKSHESVQSVFHATMIMRMSIFRIYPVKAGGELIGFLAVFAVKEDFPGPDMEFILRRSAGVLVRALFILKNILQTGRYYLDIVDTAMGKIEDSFKRVRDLNIPLTFVLFSIKNLKR